ncbi:MAG: hypothetical protein EXQ70_05020 [Solirubrobacterales bacterium]|nr:hypothetical protein [Solirubrobacterales bacterium]
MEDTLPASGSRPPARSGRARSGGCLAHRRPLLRRDCGVCGFSRHAWLNDWLGRVSAPLVAPPFISYSDFRFVHVQHHRFTNHDETQDPDAYSSNGSAWTWPLRWATQDIRYWFFYFP